MTVQELLLALHSKDLTLNIRFKKVESIEEQCVEENFVRNALTISLCDN